MTSLSSLESAIANHIWQSTVFALCMAMLTLLLRRNQARIRYGVWMAASLKFLLPFSLLTGLGAHFSDFQTATNSPAFYFAIDKMSRPFHQPGNLTGLLGIFWFLGSVTVIVLGIRRYLDVAKLKNASPLLTQGPEIESLRMLQRIAGIHTPVSLRLCQTTFEPGVLGIFRPVLLWPVRISAHLDEVHVDAILAHELQHVRRRDNLTAAFHMLVEAIFWFHPLVWWIGARLVEERERACDEAVLQLGNAPNIYAESILKTCELSVSSSLPCISGITGGDLKKRIVRIMSPYVTNHLSIAKKTLLLTMGLATLVGPIVLGVMQVPFADAENFIAPSQVYHIGGDVLAPKLVYAPDPEYTEKARKAKY
jgi:bla regulator protein blaR1